LVIANPQRLELEKLSSWLNGKLAVEQSHRLVQLELLQLLRYPVHRLPGEMRIQEEIGSFACVSKFPPKDENQKAHLPV